MTRTEAAIEALRLRKLLGNKTALDFICQFKFYSGKQWMPEQVAKMRNRE